MNLTVTWEGFEGSVYQVEYRKYPSTDNFTIFSTNITTRYVTIPNLPDGFYEVRVKTDCADGDSAYINKIGGKEPCPIIVPGGYTVISDTDTSQVIQGYYTNYTQAVKLTVKNVNTGVIINSYSGAGTGVYQITLPKFAGQTTSYHLEITNVCSGVADNFVTLLDISIQGPPAVINTSFQWLQDFCGDNNCDPASRNCSKPGSGIRIKFAEPLPQAVTIVFDRCYAPNSGGFKGQTICASNAPNPPLQYLSVTIPAGTTNYACGYERSTNVIIGSEKTCIIRTIPAVLNNGKTLNFTDCTYCVPVKSLPIFDWTAWHNQFNPSHPPCVS